ncbi:MULTISPECIES: hypothetical protein [unclassified Paenibacillus]|uniref:hypothetical protein n=1 Tax=unclassified Paenibacillus TaxID=185978 RepID=UPI003632B576
MKKYILIFILLSLLFILGCKEKNQDAILSIDEVSVNLICKQEANTNECTNQKFKDFQSFQIFKTALESAVKMSEKIDYAAEYNLSITFQDQTTKDFHLALGTNRDMKGLLVDLKNTNQGYEIPIAHANKLRDLIRG